MALWIKKFKWCMKLIFLRPKHDGDFRTNECPRCNLWEEREQLWGKE